MPVEVFVHGALCVAYSGQCLTSESLGGRSANRGQCAQACRLPYDLICDGRDVDLGEQKYLLSPQDLAAYDLIPELIAAGRLQLQDRRPPENARIRRQHRQALSPGDRRRPRRQTDRVFAARRRGNGALLLPRILPRLARRLRPQNARPRARVRRNAACCSAMFAIFAKIASSSNFPIVPSNAATESASTTANPSTTSKAAESMT